MKAISAGIAKQWEKVYKHVAKAVVFIDNTAGELLHWQGGLPRLLNAGATDVKEFSSFESGAEDQKKGVFVVSGLLVGVAKEIIRDILQASHFQYVVVITCQSSAVHSFSLQDVTEESEQFFTQVEDRLLEWMGNMNYTAEVFHVPLSAVNVGNSIFLMPGHAKLFPLVGSDLSQVELLYNNRHAKPEHKDFESLKSIDISCLPKDLQVSYKSLVCSLNGLLTELGVREDIYSLGLTSSILATELEAYPAARQRRKTVQERVSLVLVDRTLDLASVTSHNTDSLLDRIQQLLPRLPGHVTDVKVNMTPLCNADSETAVDIIAPGCLAAQSGSQEHLQTVLAGKQKEALMEVNRQLVEAAVKNGLPLSLTGKPTRVSAEQLNSTLKLFRGQYDKISRHLDWLQVAMATSHSLSSHSNRHVDELISVEKGLLQCLDDLSGTEAFTYLLKMVSKKEADKWVYSLDDILCMLVYIYSLLGAAALEQEDLEEQIQEALLDRILAEKDLPSLTQAIVGSAGSLSDRSILTDIVDNIWEKLVAIADSRSHLQLFRTILDPGSAVSPATHNPLLRQLVAAILEPSKPDLVDVENKSSGLKDILKSGFGLFRGVSKSRPSDHPLLILFVVGGVNCTEVKQIRDLVNQMKPAIQVVVGSTRLVTPAEVVQSILCKNNVTIENQS
ncbi:sec1 family domain-containing protein 2-like [Dreissena polymorpha]|uniref:Sec1 family domain-containing protein 2 n=1 Tax=Dreissena polymorpha TaxID=45954 RepID=A0A9D4FGG9_DREPO|nr:sec1 family domain-containing protein 2-like [Dreissena polymorpha]XP_052221104.1 sec1 family domain-containing protein 2-like [Dreissena polymorpha]XP_052221106.1 sec1 family domain-containing protein 2-like [Dreissena polymorpha]XP_052221107.1 sec1 family domain-containing protein 2-like [Dreissena polymorpha]KAH3796873.1 hypothetical protein DPMN_150450 [Dreissena polymorpha]